nr:reverse transcriptase domain-containing protein [Tanacetum cinerariifolium]
MTLVGQKCVEMGSVWSFVKITNDLVYETSVYSTIVCRETEELKPIIILFHGSSLTDKLTKEQRSRSFPNEAEACKIELKLGISSEEEKGNEHKCKALADLGAIINLMPFSVWKKLGLPELISTRMTLELANRAICTPAEIARDVFVSVGKFTFLVDFVIVDYESDPRVPLILGRPFLRTAHALINVHGEEMILRDGDERLILNMRHDTSSYSNQPQRESINLINPSGNPTRSFSSNPLLEEFTDELALITFPPKYDDDLQSDIESDLKEIEFLLHQDIDSSLKDSIDLANPDDIFVDSVPEMFTDEHALDYSFPPIFDEYDDDFLEIEFDAENVYDDPFDSKGEKSNSLNS